ncbi:MAG TPA: hypothetical protein VGP56_09190, partial [Gaiellaceae bacterium]|nr:hypothetical protein [Gaiellaceae bacterium]
MSDEHAFLLQRVQPAMVGLIDGSLSTLAPIFAVVLASHDTRYAFIAGLATSIGAAISMGFSEALSDTGELTGRGSPWARGLITGGGTFLGGIATTILGLGHSLWLFGFLQSFASIGYVVLAGSPVNRPLMYGATGF